MKRVVIELQNDGGVLVKSDISGFELAGVLAFVQSSAINDMSKPVPSVSGNPRSKISGLDDAGIEDKQTVFPFERP